MNQILQSMFIPAVVAALVLTAFMLLLTGQLASDAEKRRRNLINRFSAQRTADAQQLPEDFNPLLRRGSQILPTTGFWGFICNLPWIGSTYTLILKAGMSKKIGSFFMFAYGVFILLILLCFCVLHITSPFLLFLIPFIGSLYLARHHLKGRIRKRNERFILLFPDAVDMIVRSVRSGHPLNTAMRMISENMENPVKEEFKQVVDEVAYGRTLPDALQRMAERIGEQDLQFFVVVLSVQQETGGSLSEVLTNLSGIIRKRRQLRLKIRALTSEGRATSYILGSIPFVEIGALKFITPTYLDPLFTSGFTGYAIIGTALGLIFSAILIVRKMSNIDI